MRCSRNCFAIVRLIALAAVSLLAGVNFRHAAAETTNASEPNARLARLPLEIEANHGQFSSPARYVAHAHNYTLLFVPGGVEVVLHERPTAGQTPGTATSDKRLEIRFARTRAQSLPVGGEKLPGVTNYFMGSSPGTWFTGIPTFRQVRYPDIYPGVDAVFYGVGRQIEFDLEVRPGFDYGGIALDIRHADSIRLDRDGDIILAADSRALRLGRPVVYQEGRNGRESVHATYLVDGNRIRFRLGDYDRSRKLVIDPILVYGTYFPASGREQTWDVAVDDAGFAYVTGESFRWQDFTVSFGWVRKISPDGTKVVFASYLKTAWACSQTSHAVDVDRQHNIYLAGWIQSRCHGHPSGEIFPPEDGAQPLPGGDLDAYVIKLDASGEQVLYGTFIGGSGRDAAHDIAATGDGSIYVAGITESTDFPLVAPFQSGLAGETDLFITRIGPSGDFVYSTYFGGVSQDAAGAIAVDATGNIHVAGRTSSADFPTANATQDEFAGPPPCDGVFCDGDAFILKLNPAGSALVYSTHMGGSGADRADDLALDGAGNAYVAGTTRSADFPSKNAFQPGPGGGTDAFFAKFSAEGALMLASYLGGGEDDFGNAIAVDPDGWMHVAGATRSTGFPTLHAGPPFKSRDDGRLNAFLTKFTTSGTSLVFSVMIGGTLSTVSFGRQTGGADQGTALELDSAGRMYLAGDSSSWDFPVTEGAAAREPAPPNVTGDHDPFLIKVSDEDLGRGTSGSETAFSIPDGGGFSRSTAGGLQLPVRVGSARIVTDSQPAGVAILGFRQNGILVTEAGVLAEPALLTGRIYTETSLPGLNTGLAIANPHTAAVTISFFFTGSDGADFGHGSLTIPANGQISRFLTEAPFNGPPSMLGSLTFNASLPVSVVGLRGRLNARGEFLISTLPVSNLAPPSGPATLPHFADGGGWTTSLILLNPTSDVLTGRVAFLGRDGKPTSVVIDGKTAGAFDYSIPPRSARRLRTAGAGGVIQTGSVRVEPTAFGVRPEAVGVFTLSRDGVTVTEAGVEAGVDTALRLYVESSGANGAVGSIRTGIAVANPGTSESTVILELNTLEGTPTGLSGRITVPARGQFALFLDEIPGFKSVPSTFRGVLRMSGATTGLSAVGLRGRTNERGDFLISTIPVAEETAAGRSDVLFPQLAEGGGWETQIVLFSASSGHSSSGVLEFFDPSGQPMDLLAR